jgi:hypothetical protein
MSDIEIREFLGAISPEREDNVVHRLRGQIIAYDVATETVTITISGGAVECPGTHFYDWYTPTVGDEVDIISVKGSKIVLGKVRRP